MVFYVSVMTSYGWRQDQDIYLDMMETGWDGGCSLTSRKGDGKQGEIVRIGGREVAAFAVRLALLLSTRRPCYLRYLPYLP